jgi:hypothetical protein
VTLRDLLQHHLRCSACLSKKCSASIPAHRLAFLAKFGVRGAICYKALMRNWPRTRLGCCLSALIAIALIAQGASAAVMGHMMAQTSMSSSHDMPCGNCDGGNVSLISHCAMPCLAGPAILLNTTIVEMSRATFSVAMPLAKVTDHLQAPDPSPPRL